VTAVPAPPGLVTAGAAPTPPPPAAEHVFGPRLPQAVRYASLLAGPGVERGLIGPRELDRLWDRHLLNCAVLADLVPAGHVVDLGSGAGLPGLVLALLRPDCAWTLLDAASRRTTFLTEAVAALGVPNVTVVWARAETAAAELPPADAVVARAVAPLGRLVRWSAPLLRPGGVLLAIKGARAETELAAAGRDVAVGGHRAEVVRCGEGLLDRPTTVVRIRFGRPGAVR
jgi:16S rRNA (guanine527-N7)-methyltransferase